MQNRDMKGELYRVIIAGSRDFDNYELLKRETIRFLKGYRPSEIEIVSGTARGADTLGEKFAKERNCKVTRFPANWDLYGKRAGYLRNYDMAKYADACIVFMKKEGSKGSQHMIDIAEKEGLRLKIVRY